MTENEKLKLLELIIDCEISYKNQEKWTTVNETMEKEQELIKYVKKLEGKNDRK